MCLPLNFESLFWFDLWECPWESNKAAANIDEFTGPSPPPLDAEPLTENGLGVAIGLYTLDMKSSYVVLCLCFVTTVSSDSARSS